MNINCLKRNTTTIITAGLSIIISMNGAMQQLVRQQERILIVILSSYQRGLKSNLFRIYLYHIPQIFWILAPILATVQPSLM